MNILITGGAGFIGSQLGFYLQSKGHNVILVDSLAYGHIDNLIVNGKAFPQFVSLDIRDPQLETLMTNVDVVFHLAGVSSLPECNYHVYDAYSTNTAGTGNVLESARRKGVKRIIFSSTSAVYENNTIFPLSESTSVNPILIYSLSKKHSEELCTSYIQMYGMDICILRFFNIYGPHMDYLRPNPPFVSYIIKCLLEKSAPVLHSNGNQKRDMVYVDDVLKMCEIVMTHPNAKNEIFNVGSGKAYSIQEVFDVLDKAFGTTGIKPTYRRPEKIWDKYPGMFQGAHPINKEFIIREVNKYTLASIEKSKKMLGWESLVSLSDGLQKTVAFAKRDYKIRVKHL